MENNKQKYLFYKEDSFELYNGKMQDVLSTFEENSIDSIVCDPPYELNFMGKGWDNSGVAFQKETWEHCLKVLKPGGYLLAFGGTRTYHRICCAIEDAGFEIRDCIMYLYGSGFPKSMNIGFAIDKQNGVDNRTGNLKTNGAGNGKHFNLKEEKTMEKIYEERVAQNDWAGWGTCLKPAYEPVIVARKPFATSLLENIKNYGVGGLNIDECRVGNEIISIHNAPKGTFAGGEYGRGSDTSSYRDSYGRFPANVILTYDETNYEEVCGGMPNDNSGSASRYFYCAKASKKDRDEGLDLFETNKGKNIHPTVKPVELMQYLVRLVSPKNAIVLDCFMGSGSTGKACMFENRERDANYHFIGIEMTNDYLPICQARIDYAKYKFEYDEKIEKEERLKQGIISLFDDVEELNYGK